MRPYPAKSPDIWLDTQTGGRLSFWEEITDARTVSDSKEGRKRNPSYPCLNLETAIDRVETVYKKIGNGQIGDDKLTCFRSKKTSSTFRMNLAALTAFGFLEDCMDDKNNLQRRLTSLACETLGYKPASIRTPATNKAARKPKIFDALFENFGDRLPPDQSLVDYLTTEMEFKDESAAHKCIQHFKSDVRVS